MLSAQWLISEWIIKLMTLQCFRSSPTMAWHSCSIMGTYRLWRLPKFLRKMESTRFQVWTTWSDRRIENWHFRDLRRLSLEMSNLPFYHQRLGNLWTQICPETQLQKRSLSWQFHCPSIHPDDPECREFHLYRKPILYGLSKFLEFWPRHQL